MGLSNGSLVVTAATSVMSGGADNTTEVELVRHCTTEKVVTWRNAGVSANANFTEEAIFTAPANINVRAVRFTLSGANVSEATNITTITVGHRRADNGAALNAIATINVAATNLVQWTTTAFTMSTGNTAVGNGNAVTFKILANNAVSPAIGINMIELICDVVS